MRANEDCIYCRNCVKRLSPTSRHWHQRIRATYTTDAWKYVTKSDTYYSMQVYPLIRQSTSETEKCFLNVKSWLNDFDSALGKLALTTKKKQHFFLESFDEHFITSLTFNFQRDIFMKLFVFNILHFCRYRFAAPPPYPQWFWVHVLLVLEDSARRAISLFVMNLERGLRVRCDRARL